MDRLRLIWIFPFRQISGKGQFLPSGNLHYGRKKSTAIARKCLIFLPEKILVGRTGFEPVTNGLKVRCSTS
jgi:hypothetical protein